MRNIPGAHYAAHKTHYLINFTLAPAAFRPVLKRYIQLLIAQNYSLGECTARLRFVRLFLGFYLQRYPSASGVQQLSRGDVEAYLFSLRTGMDKRSKPNSDFHIWRAVNHLQYFLDYLERTSSAEASLIPVGKLIWPSDVGNAPQYRSSEVKYIPETVLHQLEQHMYKLPAKYLPVAIILRASGWRIGDVLNLRYHTCLEKTSSGWWLCGDVLKTNVFNHKVSISDEIATLIQAQCDLVKGNIPEGSNPAKYLFPSVHKRREGRPLSAKSIQYALNQLASNCEIKNDDGTIFHFKNHAFRHTKAVELINAGMSLLHVQKWLAHLTPEMTLVYAKLFDSTRQKEWEQAFARGALRIDPEGSPKVVSAEQLGNEQEIEWEHIRHDLDAVRLPNGYCFKPKKANGPTQDTPCYTCRHFCTTPDFLSQFEHEERELRELIVLGEKAGSMIWVERNTQKLNRVLPVIQIIRSGNLHHSAGKAMREYTKEERAKRNAH
ncbi:tyrosine-type recombinase/integrase [Reticulibacter mediterranei]|uniref:tyrosine-type recombinase/integrase n=1 Tax=Reticulibacter mediterranei TaxID=2778369 RepID=UPI001C68E8EA|nr:site-specific integrase [Reticulibacter mediterranei]